MAKSTPFLWYDGKAEVAMNFYVYFQELGGAEQQPQRR